MTTEIGKELRKLRVDKDERLLDMARRVGKSSAFISAVEVGKKTPPAGFEDLVVSTYDLGAEAAASMRRAADRSRKAFTIEANTALARDTAGLMARKMDSLTDDELHKIFSILSEKDKK